MSHQLNLQLLLFVIKNQPVRPSEFVLDLLVESCVWEIAWLEEMFSKKKMKRGKTIFLKCGILPSIENI